MLMQKLAKVLDPDELHIINVLTNTQPKISYGNEKSDAFETDTSVPQGDSVSVNLFTFYLAKPLDSNEHDDHDYCSTTVKTPAHIINDHQYAYINDKINLNMENADDMSHISSDIRNIEYAKKRMPSKLSSWDLIMNEEKTEESTIKRNREETWKKCKLMGTLLNTEEDVKQRKVLAMNVVNSMKEILFGDISIEVKVRSFICYVSSVFLYNCETWTLTKTLENTIDSFQRRLLGIAVLNVKWSNIATNDAVCAITRQIPWSQVITRRELCWLGHLVHLSDDTLAKIMLQYSLRQRKKPRGRQQTTWISMMKMRLLDMGLEWESANRLAEDRLAWNNFMELVCLMGFLHANLVRTIN